MEYLKLLKYPYVLIVFHHGIMFDYPDVGEIFIPENSAMKKGCFTICCRSRGYPDFLIIHWSMEEFGISQPFKGTPEIIHVLKTSNLSKR